MQSLSNIEARKETANYHLDDSLNNFQYKAATWQNGVLQVTIAEMILVPVAWRLRIHGARPSAGQA